MRMTITSTSTQTTLLHIPCLSNVCCSGISQPSPMMPMHPVSHVHTFEQRNWPLTKHHWYVIWKARMKEKQGKSNRREYQNKNNCHYFSLVTSTTLALRWNLRNFKIIYYIDFIPITAFRCCTNCPIHGFIFLIHNL